MDTLIRYHICLFHILESNNMRAPLFSMEGRNYLNNAVVISHALEQLQKEFGNVTNFKIKFKKPFNSQAEFVISDTPADGNIVGNFNIGEVCKYFSYTALDLCLPTRSLPDNTFSYFDLCFGITDQCRGMVEKGFIRDYGMMFDDDKVIFVIFEVPDTRVLSDMLQAGHMPLLNIDEAENTGDRRYKLTVSIGDQLIGYRHSTVKRFIV